MDRVGRARCLYGFYYQSQSHAVCDSHCQRQVRLQRRFFLLRLLAIKDFVFLTFLGFFTETKR